MADKKISELPLLTDVRGAFYPVVKGTGNFRVSPFSSFVFSTTGAQNNYILTVDGVTSYHVGFCILVKFHVNNNAASFINVNGLGSKEIRFGGASLDPGFLSPGRVYLLVYDGNAFEILGGGGGAGGGNSWSLLSGGTLIGDNTIDGNFVVVFNNDAQIFKSLRIKDQSGDYRYIFVPSTLTDDVQIILPALTADDVLVFRDFAQVLKNKTLGDNTLIAIGSDAEGDIYYRDAAGKLSRIAAVAAGNVLLSNGVNSAPVYGKVSSAHVDSSIQLSGLSWLLASGGALTGHNDITGAFRLGFALDQIGFGILQSAIAAGVRVDIRGLGITDATRALRVANNANNELLVVYDNGELHFKAVDGSLIFKALANMVEVGGNAHIIRVPASIPSGAAKIEFREGMALGYMMGTETENYLFFRSLATDKAVVLKKKVEIDHEGSRTVQVHYETTVPATALATTTIGSFSIPTNHIANVHSSWCISAVDGNAGGAHVRATVKNINGTTSLVGVVSSESRVNIGVPVFNIEANDTNDTIDFRFTNAASPSNRAYKVNIAATIHLTPQAS